MNDKLLSVILLSYFSNEKLKKVYNDISRVFSEDDINFELIIMDDGSEDNSYEIAQKLEKEHKNVKAFQLSRNYTSFYSAFAGLSVCCGNCAVLIPDDEQLPYPVIVDMYRIWEKGKKVIIPFRQQRRDPFFSKLISNLFYKLMNTLSEIHYPPGGADTFLIDREVIYIINKFIHPINTAIVPEILRLGFDPVYFPYKRPKGINEKSRWTIKKRIRLALDTFYSSSVFPIKFISALGIIFSLVSLILIAFYIYIKLYGNQEFWGYLIPGWTSLILFISFFSGLILLSLGVIAEYIWRIYEEVKNRPGYIIKSKKNEENSK